MGVSLKYFLKPLLGFPSKNVDVFLEVCEQWNVRFWLLLLIYLTINHTVTGSDKSYFPYKQDPKDDEIILKCHSSDMFLLTFQKFHGSRFGSNNNIAKYRQTFKAESNEVIFTLNIHFGLNLPIFGITIISKPCCICDFPRRKYRD